MVILGSKKAGLNLETLATAVDTSHPSLLTRVTSGLLALCWLALLVTVAGVKENTWYLLAIGLIGSIQNLYAVGSTRSPGALGIQLEEVEVFRGRKVIEVLKAVEESYPLVGTSLVNLFFSGIPAGGRRQRLRVLAGGVPPTLCPQQTWALRGRGAS
ncbi:hypothetical protein PG995_014485 [Apiospora arundinis]